MAVNRGHSATALEQVESAPSRLQATGRGTISSVSIFEQHPNGTCQWLHVYRMMKITPYEKKTCRGISFVCLLLRRRSHYSFHFFILSSHFYPESFLAHPHDGDDDTQYLGVAVYTVVDMTMIWLYFQ
ncbi:unnamed protein product [Heterosigma akashiwo]